jgi:hypothetical protein
MWGVFKTDDQYIVHIVPCDENAIPKLGHRIDMACPDISRVELSPKGVSIVIHEEIN